jgi:hypothetical protein
MTPKGVPAQSKKKQAQIDLPPHAGRGIMQAGARARIGRRAGGKRRKRVEAAE